MTAATLAPGPLGQAGLAMSAMTAAPRQNCAAPRQNCAVRLIDRRTGQTHCTKGGPLLVFTKAPEGAVAELQTGRGASVWEARFEPIGATAWTIRGHS